MSLGDLVTSAVILAGAVYLLYRSLVKKGGGCHGCDGGGCGSRSREPAPVRLGQPRRPAAGGDGSSRHGG